VAFFFCTPGARAGRLIVLSDEDFIHAFETATLPAAEFTHAAHVRAGWWYLRHCSFGEAIDRFSRALRAFAAANGAAGKYHETVTVVWMLLIAERLAPSSDLDWAAFADRYPELFAKPSLLTGYYTPARLESDQARRGFLMPDRVLTTGPSRTAGAVA
jgi:hypothetical protein